MDKETDSNQSITDDVSLDRYLGFNRTGHHDQFRLGLDIFSGGHYPSVPTWVLVCYFACVNVVGIIANLSICLRYLLNKDQNGIHTLILQMALSDLIALTVVSVPELMSHQSGDWTYGIATCRLYLSMEAFTVTSSIYFLIAVSLHALASTNAAVKQSGTEEKLLDEAELRSSQRSLVSRGGTLNTGQRRIKRRSVPAVLPVIFVWILAAALCIPELPLAQVIDSRAGASMCTFLSGHHLTTMRVILAVFQLLVPFVILSFATGMIVYRLCADTEDEDSSRDLKLALFMCLTFLILSVPRMMLAFAFSFWIGKNDNIVVGLERFMSPPLNYNIEVTLVPILLSFMHFLAPLVRPLFGYTCYVEGFGLEFLRCKRKDAARNDNE